MQGGDKTLKFISFYQPFNKTAIKLVTVSTLCKTTTTVQAVVKHLEHFRETFQLINDMLLRYTVCGQNLVTNTAAM